ncbi:myb-related protein P-like [Iris pallida]|uniref:Myb-related protein P-like n=1 Tax=Iris pallida TaxID=29817 RepID=A0AAX6EUM2_IRIPA|nr:myb-related protein P-like [Iris pallida]
MIVPPSGRESCQTGPPLQRTSTVLCPPLPRTRPVPRRTRCCWTGNWRAGGRRPTSWGTCGGGFGTLRIVVGSCKLKGWRKDVINTRWSIWLVGFFQMCFECVVSSLNLSCNVVRERERETIVITKMIFGPSKGRIPSLDHAYVVAVHCFFVSIGVQPLKTLTGSWCQLVTVMFKGRAK